MPPPVGGEETSGNVLHEVVHLRRRLLINVRLRLVSLGSRRGAAKQHSTRLIRRNAAYGTLNEQRVEHRRQPYVDYVRLRALAGRCLLRQ